MELFDLGSAEKSNHLFIYILDELRCPSYKLEHTQNLNLRKLDLNIVGIFGTSDNLHD